MGWEAWFTLAVVVGILVLLVRESLPTDVVMVGALTLLVAVGELRGSDMLPSISQAVIGMGNTGLITVGVLFVVVAGLVQTGAMELVPDRSSAAEIGLRRLVRLLTPVTFLSAF
jgi:hypothetical protein